jgi:predicted nucleotidyltransferase
VSLNFQGTLDQAVDALRLELGQNLYSCCVYGSAVRGNAIEGVSDINLLIILNESNVAAHQAITRAIGGKAIIDPFILARRGFERSVRAFATKFASIKRNYRVLYGADPLVNLLVDAELEKFLCEQAVRNLRLRLVYSFVTREHHQAYDKFLIRNITGIFVQFSEVLRLSGIIVPVGFDARIPIMEREFKIDGQVVRDLVELKKAPHRFSNDETIKWHERVFPVIDAALAWMESKWQGGSRE